jgi:hypothetical protein
MGIMRGTGIMRRTGGLALGSGIVLVECLLANSRSSILMYSTKVLSASSASL